MPTIAAKNIATGALISGIVAGFAASAPAQQVGAAITCTNPYSGATWQITIDYRAPAVDANPAQVSAESISWTDAKDGANYTLDRKSGELVGRVASSTGGYFRRGRCSLEAVNAR